MKGGRDLLKRRVEALEELKLGNLSRQHEGDESNDDRDGGDLIGQILSLLIHCGPRGLTKPLRNRAWGAQRPATSLVAGHLRH
jgi:hypothetical protein